MPKRRVMIIDDEEDFLMMTKKNLERTGVYEVATLPSARDVVSHVHSFKPDIILLDIIMPGKGGVEVCKEINNDPEGRHIPVIIISALDKDTDKIKAYEAGVTAYLAKPIEKKDLIAKIEKILGK